MDRLVRFNVVATSGRAVEAAGDVDTLLLDKTGHDHLRQPHAAAGLYPVPGVDERSAGRSRDAYASLGDETPEGRSVITYVRDRYGITLDHA